MAEKPLTSFRSIAGPLDVDDAALERINAQLGVPTLTKPASGRLGDRVRHNKDTDASTEGSVERAPLEKLTIEIPSYLSDALKRAALDTRTTVRHVVISALKDAGFEVAPADLIPDGRRRRGRLQ